jgi:peptidoglycan/xylan/chitin deacetylase (PgdA/CDA1 family)
MIIIPWRGSELNRNVWSIFAVLLLVSTTFLVAAGNDTANTNSLALSSTINVFEAVEAVETDIGSHSSPSNENNEIVEPASTTGTKQSVESAESVESVKSVDTVNTVESPQPNEAVAAASIALSETVTASVYKKPHFRIPVMNYHSVGIAPGNTVVITPAKLEEQMQYLADNQYDVLTLQQFIDIWEGKTPAPPKPVLLTFDDGYTDNYTDAMPILQKFHFPATLFMTPGWVDKPGYLTWEQVKEMHENGWDIQPHGMSHSSLPRMDAEKQRYEIAESRKLIEEHIGTIANVFCYPYGHYNNTSLSILKEEDYLLAFTIEQGRTDPTQHPYRLYRLFVNGEEDLKMFVTKLEKWK